MEYRKYRAETLKEAKLKMLIDVGKRGYIIKQRSVREGGLFGLFGKPMVEITVDVMTSGADKNKSSNLNMEFMDDDFNYGSPINKLEKKNNIIHNNVESDDDAYMYRKAIERIKDIGLNISKLGNNGQGELISNVRNNNGQLKLNYSNDNTDNINSELIELKSIIEKIKNLDTSKEADNFSNTKNKEFVKNDSYKILENYLKNYDFTDKIINNYINLNKYEKIYNSNKDGNNLNIDENEFIKKVVNDLLTHSVNLIDGIDIELSKLSNEKCPKVIALVGPTGVGKTTTLAKLGAYYGIMCNKKVKFISMDNYRVGAVQQLEIYSEIMEIPFNKVNSLNDIEGLFNEIENENYDIILVDTAGRSQKSDSLEEDIIEIKDYIDSISKDAIISLVVSATTKYKDLIEIFDKFSILNYNNIIATKLDETNSFGQILSAIIERELTLSYISFGQSVPEHLKSACKKNITQILFNY